MQRLRAIAAAAAFLAIGAGTFQSMYLRIFRVDAGAARAYQAELPYRKLPGLRALVERVGRTTPPGARIALWVPDAHWDGAYGYAFHRASFLLPDKRLLPMLEPDVDRVTGRYLAEAEYVACWRACPPFVGFRTIWTSPEGELRGR